MILAVTGHRPPKIGGYHENAPFRVRLRAKIQYAFESLAPAHARIGMALGVDQDCAEVCVNLRIPFTAAIPCDGQELLWPVESRRKYEALLNCAADVIVVSPGPYAHWKMQKRNVWMVDNSDALLAIWNGDLHGGTFRCVEYAREVGRTVYRIDPEKLRASP